MTKAEIVNEIAKKTGIEKSVVLTTVESFMDVVKTSLSNQEPVYFFPINVRCILYVSVLFRFCFYTLYHGE